MSESAELMQRREDPTACFHTIKVIKEANYRGFRKKESANSGLPAKRFFHRTREYSLFVLFNPINVPHGTSKQRTFLKPINNEKNPATSLYTCTKKDVHYGELIDRKGK